MFLLKVFKKTWPLYVYIMSSVYFYTHTYIMYYNGIETAQSSEVLNAYINPSKKLGQYMFILCFPFFPHIHIYFDDL